MRSDITVVIPTIPPRQDMLARAVASAVNQTLTPDALSVAVDTEHGGAAVVRQRALRTVDTVWVAFLDDDDWFFPQHLRTLMSIARDADADYAYSWFDGNDPFPQHRGRQMDPANPHHTTMTILVKTELAKIVGFANHPDANVVWTGEDWLFTQKCIEAGAKFIGTDQVTWFYNVHSGNTSGLGSRWL
jgi:glycosyltransferase involved in cell wall biosynthesis